MTSNKFITIFLLIFSLQSFEIFCADPTAGDREMFHHDPYNSPYCMTVLRANKNFENLENLEDRLNHAYGPLNQRTSNLEHLRTSEFYEEIEKIIQLIPKEQFETINPQTGQAWIHCLMPLHWDEKLMQCFYKANINLSIQTTRPDKYPGSTLACNAVMSTVNHHLLQDLQKLMLAIGFLKKFIEKYPETLELQSINRQGKAYSLKYLIHSNLSQRYLFNLQNQQVSLKEMIFDTK